MHFAEPRYTAFDTYLFGKGSYAGRVIEGSDGEFKIRIAVLAHIEGSSAPGAEATGHNG